VGGLPDEECFALRTVERGSGSCDRVALRLRGFTFGGRLKLKADHGF
jgi:hypothetical protein